MLDEWSLLIGDERVCEAIRMSTLMTCLLFLASTLTTIDRDNLYFDYRAAQNHLE